MEVDTSSMSVTSSSNTDATAIHLEELGPAKRTRLNGDGSCEDLTAAVAVLERTNGESFELAAKARSAQDAGAAALLVMNDEGHPLWREDECSDFSGIAIPVISAQSSVGVNASDGAMIGRVRVGRTPLHLAASNAAAPVEMVNALLAADASTASVADEAG